MKIIENRLNYGLPWTLPDVYLFTGNPITTGNGKLVMGRGAAAAVRDRYRGVDVAMAQAVLGAKKHGRHLAWVAIEPQQAIGWFQVKAHWQEIAAGRFVALHGTVVEQVLQAVLDASGHSRARAGDSVRAPAH